MYLGKRILAGEFQAIGVNAVDVGVVCKIWDSRFAISSWNDTEFRIFAVRKNGKSYLFKLTISADQAREIISRLNLARIQSPFASGATYRMGAP
jgi:hypothetical protein